MQRNQPNSLAEPVMAPAGFAELGMGEVAYVKLEEIDGKRLFVIHAANGDSLAAAETQALAAAVIVQNDMVPLYTH
jgi:hypothetical protein